MLVDPSTPRSRCGCGRPDERQVRDRRAAVATARGATRATRDIGILIEPTVENARSVLAALTQLGLGLAKDWLAEEIVQKPVTVIGDRPRIDILTVAWTVHHPEAIADAEEVAPEGVVIPTASLDHLIASKRTGRTQDLADIEMLEEIKRRQ